MWTLDEKIVGCETCVPFVVDICRVTFEQLQQLLSHLYDSVIVHTDGRPPSQFTECLVASVLSLLKLQVLVCCLLIWHLLLADGVVRLTVIVSDVLKAVISELKQSHQCMTVPSAYDSLLSF